MDKKICINHHAIKWRQLLENQAKKLGFGPPVEKRVIGGVNGQSEERSTCSSGRGSRQLAGSIWVRRTWRQRKQKHFALAGRGTNSSFRSSSHAEHGCTVSDSLKLKVIEEKKVSTCLCCFSPVCLKYKRTTKLCFASLGSLILRPNRNTSKGL